MIDGRQNKSGRASQFNATGTDGLSLRAMDGNQESGK